MKLKLLLAPSLALIAIVLLIWIVYPQFTNGIDGTLEKRANLKKIKNDVSNIQEKKSRIEKMAAQIDNDKDRRTTLMEFVPDSRKDEEIFDNLSYMANAESLSVTNISLEKGSPAVASPASVEDQPLDVAQGIIPPPKADEFEVSVVVSGEYDNLKKFFARVSGLRRYARFNTLHITKGGEQTDQNGKPITSSGLVAEMSIVFDSYKNRKLTTLDIPVFNLDTLDMSVLDKIKSSKTSELVKLDSLDIAEKANPFLP